MASTQSPTRAVSLSPKLTKGSDLSALTFNSAISVLGSVPTTSAASVSPEKNSMLISSADSMTWLLVTTKPSSEMTKPEPSAEERRGRSPSPMRSRNCSKKSSKGEPSGTIGEGPVPRSTTVEVVMLTTEGLTLSARSAKLSGRACAAMACASSRPTVRAISHSARSGVARDRVSDISGGPLTGDGRGQVKETRAVAALFGGDEILTREPECAVGARQHVLDANLHLCRRRIEEGPRL